MNHKTLSNFASKMQESEREEKVKLRLLKCKSDRNKQLFAYLIFLKNMLGVENSINDVLILDSCSFKKYSVHLIFPKIIFASYLSCREFVNCVLRLVSAENLDDFMVTSNRGKQVLFIDSCVYSKNQSFRQVIHYGFILHSLK